MNTDVCAHEGEGLSNVLAEFGTVSVSTQERGILVLVYAEHFLQRVDERSLRSIYVL